MVSDIAASYIGIALGIGLSYTFIKYFHARHVFFAVLFVAGAALAALGALFLAWPLTHHIERPILVSFLLWTGLCVRLFLQYTSASRS